MDQVTDGGAGDEIDGDAADDAGQDAELAELDDGPRGAFRPPFEPTPEEIARETALIRAGWSDEERERRIVGGQRRVAWQIPGVDRYHQKTDRDALRSFMGTGAAPPESGDVWGHQRRDDGQSPPRSDSDAQSRMPFDD